MIMNLHVNKLQVKFQTSGDSTKTLAQVYHLSYHIFSYILKNTVKNEQIYAENRLAIIICLWHELHKK